MTAVKVNNQWQEISAIHAKVNNVWSEVQRGWAKVNNVWTPFFQPAGAPAEGFYNGVIDYSCMFDSASATYLVHSGFSDPNHSDQVTFSAWVKRSTLGTTQTLFSGKQNSSNLGRLWFDTNDKLFIHNVQGGANQGICTTDAVFRDCSGWYNVFMVLDNTESSNATRFQIWVNGVQINLTFTDATVLNGNINFIRPSNGIQLGRDAHTTSNYFNGYMADVHLFHNQALAATDFGEFKDGVWIPKDTSGLTYNALVDCRLEFATSTHFGDDTSGNANDFTDHNFGTDHQVTDTPENNHCTLDYNNTRSNITTFSEGGLSITDAGAAGHSALGSMVLKSGKWYWEIDIGADTSFYNAGILAAGEYSGDVITTDLVITSLPFAWFIQSRGIDSLYRIWNNGSFSNDDNLDPPAANDIIMIAIDCDNNKIWFGVNGTWGDFGATGIGDPANGTNPSFNGVDFDLYDYVPLASVYQAGGGSLINFGQRTFAHTPPTGFKALNTENLPAPVVNDPQDEYVNVVTYTGDGAASNAITGVGFQPDFVWIKNRSAGDSHQIFDDQRGVQLPFDVDTSTASESTDADTLLSFDADGFTVGADVKVNTNAENYVAWCLTEQAGFFDIVLFEGTGSAHAESHNLGVTPEMMIVWNRTAGRSTYVYHHNALNKTDPETDRSLADVSQTWSDDATAWNDTAPTSTEFTVGTSSNTNENGQSMLAYLFASVDGISKVFSYEGNGNAAGPYVYCGFRPKWILLKNADGSDSWQLYDTERSVYNPIDDYLAADVSQAEQTGTTHDIDITSNGFKIRSASTIHNDNNNTIVGIAFAEQPFKYSNAR